MAGKDGRLPRVLDDVMTPRNGANALSRIRPAPGETVRYTKVEQWEVVAAPSPFLPRTRGRASLALAAAALIGLTALVTWWLTATRTPAVRSAQVTVPLPKSEAPAPRSEAPEKPLPRFAVMLPATPVAGKAAPEPTSAPATESAAIARAFATNEPTAWEGPDSRGMVVVGVSEIVGGRLCRDVAILTRSNDGPDRTVNSRKCRGPDRRIADVMP